MAAIIVFCRYITQSAATFQQIPVKALGVLVQLRKLARACAKNSPGLHGFSAGNMKFMRQFYEIWSPVLPSFGADFKSINAAIDLKN